MRLWKHGQGYDTNGLDYIISLRGEHYLQQQQERTLNKGDRVALLGRGIAVVEKTNDKEALVVLWNKHAVRIARKDISLNEENMRWECEAKSQLLW
jgi:preprotein translocase subunit YajC